MKRNEKIDFYQSNESIDNAFGTCEMYAHLRRIKLKVNCAFIDEAIVNC